MWAILKIFIEFITIVFLFWFFGVWGLNTPPFKNTFIEE